MFFVCLLVKETVGFCALNSVWQGVFQNATFVEIKFLSFLKTALKSAFYPHCSSAFLNRFNSLLGVISSNNAFFELLFLFLQPFKGLLLTVLCCLAFMHFPFSFWEACLRLNSYSGRLIKFKWNVFKLQSKLNRLKLSQVLTFLSCFTMYG